MDKKFNIEDLSKEDVMELTAKFQHDLDKAIEDLQETNRVRKVLWQTYNYDFEASNSKGRLKGIDTIATTMQPMAIDFYTNLLYISLLMNEPFVQVSAPKGEEVSEVADKEVKTLTYYRDECEWKQELKKAMHIMSVEGSAIVKIYPKRSDGKLLAIIDCPSDQSNIYYPSGYSDINSKISERNIPWIAHRLEVPKQPLIKSLQREEPKYCKLPKEDIKKLEDQCINSMEAMTTGNKSRENITHAVKDLDGDYGKFMLEYYEIHFAYDFGGGLDYYVALYNKIDNILLSLKTIKGAFNVKKGKLFWHKFSMDDYHGEFRGRSVIERSISTDKVLSLVLSLTLRYFDRVINPRVLTSGSEGLFNDKALVEMQNDEILNSYAPNAIFQNVPSIGNLPLELINLFMSAEEKDLRVHNYAVGRDSEVAKSGQAPGIVGRLMERTMQQYRSTVDSVKCTLNSLLTDMYYIIRPNLAKNEVIYFEDGKGNLIEEQIERDLLRVNPLIRIASSNDEFSPMDKRNAILEFANTMFTNPYIVKELQSPETKPQVKNMALQLLKSMVSSYTDILPGVEQLHNELDALLSEGIEEVPQEEPVQGPMLDENQADQSLNPILGDLGEGQGYGY